MKNLPPLPAELCLHDALLDLLHARNLTLVEMDQIIYPDDSATIGGRIGQPEQCRVYLQVLDSHKNTLATGTYLHALTRGESPFMGVRAVEGSARQQVLDALAKTLSEQTLQRK